ncbi:alpha/beta fold hydrolase [Hahella sp. NBU794]|uniref:alpha/beta fold hydrolase n=1 Tax=Hahella sp. NBU794 TaxID=3422590 RepID=UPI003D6F7D89
MLTLYPELKPHKEHFLPVDNIHTIYIEESGNKDGLPVLFVHDGPGYGSDPFCRRLLDSERFRIIMIDQRGCGKSTPLAETAHNRPDILIQDIERVRQHLSIDKWMLVGMGWGGFLSQQYAGAHPEAVLGVVISGFFVADEAGISWMLAEGAPRMFPDIWHEVMKDCPRENVVEVLSYFSKYLNGSNELLQIQAAKQWAAWVAKISTLHPCQDLVDRLTHPHQAIALAKLGCKFYQELSDRPASSNSHFKDLPGIIVHGRYDAISPLARAFDLHQNWAGSDLYIIRDAGHSVRDPAMVDALIKSIGSMADRIGGVSKLNG